MENILQEKHRKIKETDNPIWNSRDYSRVYQCHT